MASALSHLPVLSSVSFFHFTVEDRNTNFLTILRYSSFSRLPYVQSLSLTLFAISDIYPNSAWHGYLRSFCSNIIHAMWYSSQLKGRNIRLLRLELDTYKAPIRCHLVEASLDNLPEYEALSYVWGDPSKTEQIVCDGQAHHITINAARALRRIRLGMSPPKSKRETADQDTEFEVPAFHEVSNSSVDGCFPAATSARHKSRPYRPELLWIDSVCIDQTNDLERNSQVQLMREIYSKAQRVIVWLGDTKASGKNMSLLVAAAKFIAPMFTRDDLARFNFRSLTMGDIRSILGRKSWLDTDPMCSAALSSKWFNRVWCIQEVLLPPEALLLFRNAESDCEDMAKLLGWTLMNVFWDLRADPSQFPRNLKCPDNLGVASMLLNRAILKQVSAEQLLYESKLSQASDPRDKFYGLSGLFEHILNEVDYEKSVSEVYRDSVLQTAANGLRVLSYVYHGSNFTYSQDMTSWVPDWNLDEGPHVMWKGQRKESLASRRQVTTYDLALARAGILQLDGILCGSIATTTDVLCEYGEPQAPLLNRLRHVLLNLLSNPLSLSSVQAWAKVFTAYSISGPALELEGAEREGFFSLGIYSLHRDSAARACAGQSSLYGRPTSR